MITRSQNGHPLFGISALIASLAALKALDVTDHVPYEEFTVGDGSVAGVSPRRFYYHPTSVLAGDDIFVVAPTTGAGRYLLAPGHEQDIPLVIAFGTADAAILATLPAGCYMRIARSYWEPTADWTGGASSAIGLSSSNASYNTKGDLHGGAAGDVAATLVLASVIADGTVGAKVGAGILLKPTNTVRFDRITSAFTAGTGFAHLVGRMIRNAGA